LASPLCFGIDPLAVDYKRLFPKWQGDALTIAGIGEKLPFDDGAFEVVLSDNVVDHAEDPVGIVKELVRVLKPGGILYFTVNIHHPVYDLMSRAHGLWNALGLKIEMSAFADHTVHFTETKLRNIFSRLDIKTISQTTNIAEMRSAYRKSKVLHPEVLLKKVFFKNAVFEIVALRPESSRNGRIAD
jgi:SAM-dependent methyltransferase